MMKYRHFFKGGVMNIYLIYEQEKEKLQALNLTQVKYESALKELIERLKL